MPDLKVGRASEIPKGQYIVIRLPVEKGDAEDGPEVIIVNAGEKFFAFDRMCPHWNYPLEWALEWYPLQYSAPPSHTILTCNAHTNEFDLETGKSLGIATTNCLEIYPVRVENGDVYLSLEGDGQS